MTRIVLTDSLWDQLQAIIRTSGMIFFAVRKEVDTEWVSIDGSYVRAHQHASGARRGECRAIGQSRGGPTTKIHMAADAHGNPLCFAVTQLARNFKAILTLACTFI